MVDADSKD